MANKNHQKIENNNASKGQVLRKLALWLQSVKAKHFEWPTWKREEINIPPFFSESISNEFLFL